MNDKKEQDSWSDRIYDIDDKLKKDAYKMFKKQRGRKDRSGKSTHQRVVELEAEVDELKDLIDELLGLCEHER